MVTQKMYKRQPGIPREYLQDIRALCLFFREIKNIRKNEGKWQD